VSTFSHLDEQGKARMVDIGPKKVTKRNARARCVVRMEPGTLAAIRDNTVVKGDVLAVAKIAGIQAAKKTAELIPLCHPLNTEHIDILFSMRIERGELEITSAVSVHGKTGAEMEALEAVVQAALTVYDMCKAVDRGMAITDIMLVEKSGGKSGTWKRR